MIEMYLVEGLRKRIALAQRGLPPKALSEQLLRQQIPNYQRIILDEIKRRGSEIKGKIVAQPQKPALACLEFIERNAMRPLFKQSLEDAAKDDWPQFALRFDFGFGVFQLLNPLRAIEVDPEQIGESTTRALSTLEEKRVMRELPIAEQSEFVIGNLAAAARYRQLFSEDETGFKLLDFRRAEMGRVSNSNETPLASFLNVKLVIAGADFALSLYKAIYPYKTGSSDII